MQMRECNPVSPLFSVSQRAPQRRQGTHSFWLPSFRPHLLARLHVLIGSPASDPGGARCAATSTSRREGCGRSRLRANNFPTMDNQPNFAERMQLLRETAYKLREAAETVLPKCSTWRPPQSASPSAPSARPPQLPRRRAKRRAPAGSAGAPYQPNNLTMSTLPTLQVNPALGYETHPRTQRRVANKHRFAPRAHDEGPARHDARHRRAWRRVHQSRDFRRSVRSTTSRQTMTRSASTISRSSMSTASRIFFKVDYYDRD